jgi:tryptophan synthase alpha chain
MGYYNPMLAYGLEKFVNDACEAGADGFIIPDLPMEESEEFEAVLGDMPLIPMLAPTSSPERMESIARNAKGFIYLVSVTGITGERKSLAEGLGDLIAQVREHTSVPVCVGFGIGTPEQAKAVGKMADGAIVGTACVKTVGGSQTPVETAKQFAVEFRNALSELRK